MVAGLGEFGYVVDVVSRRDRAFRISKEYDLVISDRLEWPRADERRLDRAKRVFFATTMHHRTHNANVRQRHQKLLERRRCAIQQRRIYGEDMPSVASSHAIIGVGNEFTMGTWARELDGPIHTVDTHGVPSPDGAIGPKDFAEARRSFLFFASGSQMQKGLDLLLEVFPRLPDLHLYVCSRFAQEPDFCACYRQELFDTANVHPVGWVQVNGPEFARVARACACVIYPTCSEGQAGAVVQAMHAGLVPLVTRESGIDTQDFGITLADDSLDGIARLLQDVARQSPDWHRDRAERSCHIARTRYTGTAFASRWRDLIARVVAGRP